MTDNQANGFKDLPDDLSHEEGNLCPHCGDTMPPDGSACPSCRHVVPDDPHGETVEGCASCGSVGPERWNLPDGTQVCEECWLEMGERAAKSPVGYTPEMPAAPDPQINLWFKRDYHSVCLICNYIHYDTKRRNCAKCGEPCVGRSSKELALLTRRLLFKQGGDQNVTQQS
jgi:hypothetical protein